MTDLIPNPNKNISIVVDGREYSRFPVKTQVIAKADNIVEIIKQLALPEMVVDDFLFISEKIVAISQGRAFPISEIHPSKLANFLSKLVHKSAYGIGLGSPWTMELAIREAGVMRIFFGMVVAGVTKPFGIKGMFYRVVGKNINAIDGPCSYTLPPYNNYAKLGPRDPDKVAKKIKEKIGHEVVIIDANDLGVNVLGKSSSSISDDWVKKVFKDNPLGQTNEQTPLCIVRKN